jgi:hypothetical protein
LMMMMMILKARTSDEVLDLGLSVFNENSFVLSKVSHFRLCYSLLIV